MFDCVHLRLVEIYECLQRYMAVWKTNKLTITKHITHYGSSQRMRVILFIFVFEINHMIESLHETHTYAQVRFSERILEQLLEIRAVHAATHVDKANQSC